MRRFDEIKCKLREMTGLASTSLGAPHDLRKKQLIVRGVFVGAVIVGLCVWVSSSASETAVSKPTKPSDVKMADLSTPFKAVDEREIWVNRVEKKTAEIRQEAEKIKEENQFLQKRIDIIEELFKNHKPISTETQNPPQPSEPAEISQEQPSFQSPQTQPKPYPGKGYGGESESASFPSGQNDPMRKRGPKIAHIGGGKFSNVAYKTSDLYLPAGSYSKAVVTSGVAASTATNAMSNPQPMMLRLVDDGNLPRGFKSRVRDAVVLGACYGDISSERVLCRLETMSWVEPNGLTVEKKIEGWVIGEDGRAGLRGQVVDRSSEIAREAFGAGILSSIASFFKFEAQTSVYPVTPFGQTNALSSKDALQGAAASGAGNALDKLAEFSIKRAEQMQPVILVASGRVVDIVFKSGVDLSPDSQAEMQVVGANNNNSSETGEN